MSVHVLHCLYLQVKAASGYHIRICLSLVSMLTNLTPNLVYPAICKSHHLLHSSSMPQAVKSHLLPRICISNAACPGSIYHHMQCVMQVSRPAWWRGREARCSTLMPMVACCGPSALPALPSQHSCPLQASL